jgi:hypothetical protein
VRAGGARMSGEQRLPVFGPAGETRRSHRPRGRVRAAAAMLSPVALAAGRVALERVLSDVLCEVEVTYAAQRAGKGHPCRARK